MFRLWDRNIPEAVKTLSFDTSVSSMEYLADGDVVLITYGKTIAFYNAHRYSTIHRGTHHASTTQRYTTSPLQHTGKQHNLHNTEVHNITSITNIGA